MIRLLENIDLFCFFLFIVKYSINSVTQTAMKNMLKRVSLILNSTAKDLLNIMQPQVDEILSNNIGDARNALLNIIFISLKGK